MRSEKQFSKLMSQMPLVKSKNPKHASQIPILTKQPRRGRKPGSAKSRKVLSPLQDHLNRQSPNPEIIYGKANKLYSEEYFRGILTSEALKRTEVDKENKENKVTLPFEYVQEKLKYMNSTP